MAALGSLTNRIFLASALLALLSIGLAVAIVSSQLRAEAEADLTRDLNEAANLVEQQHQAQLDAFARMARLIADLPTLKATIELGDAPTTEPLAKRYHRDLGADLFRVTDRRGRTLAEIGGSAGGVLQVVTVPVMLQEPAPEELGSLTVGYLLDDERANAFKAATGAEIAFAVGGEIRAATFPRPERHTLAALQSTGTASRLVIGGAEHVALVRHLPAASDDHDMNAPTVLVLRSRTERMRTLSTIETALGLSAIVTFVLAIGVSYGVARTVTRPLARITDHMRQVAATGDLTQKIELTPQRWQDEDARVLATTFNTLTDSVARFQREAAQRERLSSLGRLSTVIAHEVRNPLMIIKGALRQIRRAGAGEDDVRDAAADIDGEIERLNRVVNEVLDFARPIRFDPSPTDVNALCRAAVAAVAAAEPDPPVTADLDPQAPVLETDGERLRIALVNLLTNARQAVLAQNGRPRPTGEAPVTLVTSRLSDRRVAVSIRDVGVGIAPENLGRIFDPYFTTRRAGTGLGLPIAKNIIEGLGGTITVTSTPNAGTRIRIELGDAPAVTS